MISRRVSKLNFQKFSEIDLDLDIIKRCWWFAGGQRSESPAWSSKEGVWQFSCEMYVPTIIWILTKASSLTPVQVGRSPAQKGELRCMLRSWIRVSDLISWRRSGMYSWSSHIVLPGQRFINQAKNAYVYWWMWQDKTRTWYLSLKTSTIYTKVFVVSPIGNHRT